VVGLIAVFAGIFIATSQGATTVRAAP